ncbi:type IV pilin protein [Halopseudomonas xiamenensis]|uniref:type IV pilin protein n=1 Tax=Halopseudomonas xiamenensis TaxID=157792 RepID=UPI0016243239|nr:type IV pilin protein [Halopseudomonas xiamenensis]
MKRVLSLPRRGAGFTLIEVMIVVVIVGILAAIAYPSYQRYVQNTREAEAQGQIMELASTLEAYRAKHFSYKDADTKLSTLAPELSGSKYYEAKITPGASNQSYTIEANPKTGLMSGKPKLTYGSDGTKSW